MEPFIKWVGGKRQLLPELKQYMPETFQRYYEPFIGGGAFLLSTVPKKATIGDMNQELVITWQMVKDNPQALLKKLAIHQANNSEDYYYSIRSLDREEKFVQMSDLERAARFIFLNKTSYNGLWRVNSKGQHNVPYNKNTSVNLVNADNLLAVSHYLNECDIQIQNQSYLTTTQKAKKGDFVYFDPPYIPVTATSSFTSYVKDGFNEKDQIKLRDLAKELYERGVSVMISNSSAPAVYELYKEFPFHIHEVYAKRAINSNGEKRGKVKEVIITTY